MHDTSGQALVLDFGGVISRTLFETHLLSERALGLPPGTLTWKGPFDPMGDTLWADMQADKISERDYYLARARQVGALLGETWNDMETLVRRARGADVEAILRPEALAAIEAARAAGCKLAVLSNELDLFYGVDFRQRLPLLHLFDVVVDATYTHILKPDPRAYQQCLDELKLPAQACVFVDDQWRNIHGARKAGWRAVHLDVTQPGAAYREALQLLKVPVPAELQL
jgi:putative hydrolase of the HAD superfamily